MTVRAACASACIHQNRNPLRIVAQTADKGEVERQQIDLDAITIAEE
jgi:hypothetical protein